MSQERVQKILATTGLGSRRACEKFIAEGRVTVNGQKITLGAKANPLVDDIRVDGRIIKYSPDFHYFLLYKPRGILSSSKTEHGRKSVVDLIPTEERLFPIGRLDIESEGLILLTNDGELANRLTHPSFEHEKEYRVLVAKHPDNEQMATWARGVVLEDGYRTKPVNIALEKFQGKGAWLKIIMKEGRKRQIRETASQLGLPVVKLIRTRMSSIGLGNLKPGQSRELTPQEVRRLKQ